MALFERIFDWLSNLRPRQLFLLAAVSAIVIFGIIYLVLKTFLGDQVTFPSGENPEPVVQPQVKMVSVVVAAKTIEPQSMIIGSMLTTKEVPENEVPSDAVTDTADIANKPAKLRIMKDEIILHNQVYRTMEQAGFVGSIPPDCRAISINVSDVTGVAGFAKPGDYVDVLVIENDETTVTSRLILQNVLLLSINKSMTGESTSTENQSSENNTENESTVNPATKAIENPALATLALRPDEVLQLISASKIGEIYLMLRPLVPQGDYYNGAEYSLESLKGKNDRIRAEQEKAEKAEAEKKKKLMSLEEQLIPELRKDKDHGASVSKENKIEIMYGNEDNDKSTSDDSGDNNKSKITSVTEAVKGK